MKNKWLSYVLPATLLLTIAIVVGFGLRERLVWRTVTDSTVDDVDVVVGNISEPDIKSNKNILQDIYQAHDYQILAMRLGDCDWQTEIVKTPAATAQGLSDRLELATDSAMLFVMPGSEIHHFWMPRMHFSLDIVWLQDGRVVDISHRVPYPDPGTPLQELPLYSPTAPANLVLEINASLAETCGIEVGKALESPASMLE